MSTKFKIPATLLLTALLAVLIKVFLPTPHENSETKNDFWLRKTHTNEKFNIVVGGDSRINRGFSIAAMQQELTAGLTGVNIGYSSSGYSKEYMTLLRNRLKKTEPTFLVLGLSPHSFTAEAAKNELYHQYKNTGKFELFKGLYLSKYLKHFAAYKISELWKYAFNITDEGVYFEEFSENGWVKSYKTPEDSLVALEIYKGLFTKYQVEDTIVANFLEEIDIISESTIKIIAFRTPTLISMAELEDSLSGYKELELKAELEKRGVIWVDFKNEDFHTYDGSHLHYESAEKLGRRIGEVINEIYQNSQSN